MAYDSIYITLYLWCIFYNLYIILRCKTYDVRLTSQFRHHKIYIIPIHI